MESTHARVIPEPFRATLPIDASKSDFELCECSSKNVKEVPVLREDNRFGSWVVLTNPQDMPSQGVDLHAKRAIQVDLLDLAQREIADARIY